jgi:hypothetical protein
MTTQQGYVYAPDAIDGRISDNLKRAIDIYDKVFYRGEKPTEHDVVALIAQALVLEQSRVSLAIQLEALLGELRSRRG